MLAQVGRALRSRSSSITTRNIPLSCLCTHFDPHVLDENNSIVGAFTPVTKKLWQERYKWDADTLAEAVPQTNFTPKASERTEVVYPFASDPVLREHYRNPWSGVRIGRLLEDMDSLAGYVAYHHADDGDPASRPPVLVTATVEAINFFGPPLLLLEDMRLAGRVIYTGKSSLDMLMEVRQGTEDAPPKISALFTFVARDVLKGTPHPITQLELRSGEERRLFAQRKERADARKAARQEEKERGHKWTHQQVAWALDLVTQAHTKLNLPALADPTILLMPDTSLENTFTTQPQQRNIHGRIFGGFLMRRAFELAHSTGHLLSACRPLTVIVDEIQFKRPVEVGDLVRFRSRVLRTWADPTSEDPGKGMIHVQVTAYVVKPEALQTYESNTFNFLFKVQRRRDAAGNFLPLPRVLPVTEEQALEVCAFAGPGSERRHVA